MCDTLITFDYNSNGTREKIIIKSEDKKETLLEIKANTISSDDFIGNNEWHFTNISLHNQNISSEKFNLIYNSIFHNYPKDARFYNENNEEEEFNNYYDLFSLNEGAMYSYILLRLQQNNINQQNIEVIENFEIDGDINNNSRESLIEGVFNKKSPNMLCFGSDGHYGLMLFNFENKNEKIYVLDFDLCNFVEKEQNSYTNKNSNIKPKVDIFGKYTDKIFFLNKDSLQSDRCGCCGLIAAIAYIKISKEYTDLQDSSQKIKFEKLEKDCNSGLFQFKIMSDVEQIVDKKVGLKQIVKSGGISEEEKDIYHEIKKGEESFFILNNILDASSICTDIGNIKKTIGRFILSTALEHPINYKPEYNDGIVSSLIDIMKSDNEGFKKGTIIDFGRLIHSNETFKEEINKHLEKNIEIANSLSLELEKCRQKLGLERVYNFLVDDIPDLSQQRQQRKRTSSLPNKSPAFH